MNSATLAARLGLLAAALLGGCRSGGPRPPSSSRPPAARLTAPGPRFFAVGDGGTGSPSQYQTARAIRDKCRASGCDFGVLLGDNFYPYGVTSVDDPQWQEKFEGPYAEVLALGVPFYALLGNHDYADGQDFSRDVHQVAYGESHPQWRMPAAHYHFTQGGALFLALDTTVIEAGRRHAEREQEEMVTGALAGNARPWVVALGHHPYASNGSNGDALPRLARFLEGQVCGKADVYLAAHDHNLQVLPPLPACATVQVVAGGGGYETYPLPGGHPALFQAQSLGFAYVSVDGARLRVELVGPDGATLFTHDLTK